MYLINKDELKDFISFANSFFIFLGFWGFGDQTHNLSLGIRNFYETI